MTRESTTQSHPHAKRPRYPYRPTTILDSVAELANRVHDPFGDGAFTD